MRSRPIRTPKVSRSARLSHRRRRTRSPQIAIIVRVIGHWARAGAQSSRLFVRGGSCGRVGHRWRFCLNAMARWRSFGPHAALLLIVPGDTAHRVRRGSRSCLIAKATGSSSRGSGRLTRADVVPMQWVQRVRHSGASVGHRSEHLADITWDAHVSATAGAERRKRIRLRHAGVVPRSSLRARPVGGGSPVSARRSAGGCPRCRSRT